mgnify:CR=1 FL=1
MGCDFWIDTEEDAPSVVTRMTSIQPSWATTKGEIFKTRYHKEIPGKFFKQNLWKLSGTAYFEKDDHLIPFKSIDMLEMIEKQKSSFQKIFRNYKYKCLLHFCYVNRHKLQFRIPPELWRRIAPYGLLVDFDLYLFSKSKKNNINRIKAGTEMGCTLYIETGKNDPGIVTELTGISPTPTYPTPSSALTRSSMRKTSGSTTRSTTENHRNTSIWYINPTKYWT